MARTLSLGLFWVPHAEEVTVYSHLSTGSPHNPICAAVEKASPGTASHWPQVTRGGGLQGSSPGPHVPPNKGPSAEGAGGGHRSSGLPAHALTRSLSAFQSRRWRSSRRVRRKASSVFSQSLPKPTRCCPRSSSSTAELWRLSWASLPRRRPAGLSEACRAWGVLTSSVPKARNAGGTSRFLRKSPSLLRSCLQTPCGGPACSWCLIKAWLC